MPIIFEVHYKDGTSDSLKTWIENQFHEITIPNLQKNPISFVLFDPGRKVVKKVTFERNFEELSEQAKMARNMIDRYDALVAMRSIPISTKRNVLFVCYHREKFHLTKSEIIYQLSVERTDSANAIFHLALNDPDANVRKTILREISPVPASLRNDFEKALQDSSYLNIELALQNLCMSFPENTDMYLEQTNSLTGWRGLNIRMRWLEIAIRSGKREYLQELISYSDPKFEFETRMNSLSTLKKLQYKDDITLENARSASKHWNNKLRDVGKEYLIYFGY